MISAGLGVKFTPTGNTSTKLDGKKLNTNQLTSIKPKGLRDITNATPLAVSKVNPAITKTASKSVIKTVKKTLVFQDLAVKEDQPANIKLKAAEKVNEEDEDEGRDIEYMAPREVVVGSPPLDSVKVNLDIEKLDIPAVALSTEMTLRAERMMTLTLPTKIDLPPPSPVEESFSDFPDDVSEPEELFGAPSTKHIESFIKAFKQTTIPIEKLDISYSRSSGPGGQNVNKVNTKVDLRFIPSEADWLPPEIRSKIELDNAAKLNKKKQMILMSDRYRTQSQNVTDCITKLHALILESAESLIPKETSPETLERIKEL
ncbi:hypothetical protein HDU97_000470 [Phlyctochytrium planicorne]|nr:hypothetical protein HDU97_000470 [Phlyctochytrium planicorne]